MILHGRILAHVSALLARRYWTGKRAHSWVSPYIYICHSSSYVQISIETFVVQLVVDFPIFWRRDIERKNILKHDPIHGETDSTVISLLLPDIMHFLHHYSSQEDIAVCCLEATDPHYLQ